MKARLRDVDVMNYWLKKYHNIDVDWLLENEPELIKTSDWYVKYAVSQEQHDEWYNWVIETLHKQTRLGKKYIKRSFAFDYLNLAPSAWKQKK